MHPARIIQKKRDGCALSADEIRTFVQGVVDGRVVDGQLGAFLMAVCCRGMNAEETTTLTLAMRDSGRVLDLGAVAGVKVDKHSTGGVGDKVSLLLAPLVAAAGVPVPMISGRGLGHTGGTLDKLAAIPGYRTELSAEEFEAVLEDCGYVMAGPSADIAPADRRMYALRDVSATVESTPLIVSSILSKKLASGLDALVLDVKCGRAAFMQSQDAARELMAELVRTGRQAGKKVRALLTNMDTPLGCAVGNSLEVREVLEALSGHGPADLLSVTLALGGEMLVLGGQAETPSEGEQELQQLLHSGAALEFFSRNVERQGGNRRVVDDPGLLGIADDVVEVLAEEDGHVADIDPMAVGLAAVDLGGGRKHPDDQIDLHVGVLLKTKLGDEVRRGDVLAEIHASSQDAATRARERVQAAFTLGPEPVDPSELILARM